MARVAARRITRRSSTANRQLRIARTAPLRNTRVARQRACCVAAHASHHVRSARQTPRLMRAATTARAQARYAWELELWNCHELKPRRCRRRSTALNTRRASARRRANPRSAASALLARDPALARRWRRARSYLASASAAAARSAHKAAKRPSPHARRHRSAAPLSCCRVHLRADAISRQLVRARASRCLLIRCIACNARCFRSDPHHTRHAPRACVRCLRRTPPSHTSRACSRNRLCLA